MVLKLIIGDTDLSKYIEPGTYIVDIVREFEEWTDANYKKHREYHDEKFKGSVELSFINGYTNKLDIWAFRNLLEANTYRNITTMTVTALGRFLEIQAYTQIETVAYESNEHEYYRIKFSFEEV